MDLDYDDLLDIALGMNDDEERQILYRYAILVRRRERARALRNSVGFIIAFAALVVGCAVFALGNRFSIPFIEIAAIGIAMIVLMFGQKPLRKKLNARLDRKRQDVNNLEDASLSLQVILTEIQTRELV